MGSDPRGGPIRTILNNRSPSSKMCQCTKVQQNILKIPTCRLNTSILNAQRDRQISIDSEIDSSAIVIIKNRSFASPSGLTRTPIHALVP